MFVTNKASLRRSLQQCLASLPGDIRLYTTAMFARDVHRVLGVLHYTKVNLIGGSYGATAAQVYQRFYPKQVRTMTLLGGSLLDVPIFERWETSSQQALDQVFSRCGQGILCHRAFPKLDSEWSGLRASIAASLVIVPAKDSPTQTRQEVTSDVLANQVHEALLSSNVATDLPVVIHALATGSSRGATLGEIGKLLAAAESGESQATSMITYPIRCDEPWARFDPPRSLARTRASTPRPPWRVRSGGSTCVP